MTIPTTNTNATSRIIKQQSSRTKSSKTKKKRNTFKYRPLLPQVIGIYQSSDGNPQLVIKDRLADVRGEFWTTEKLADELFDCLIRKEAEPDLVTISSANDDYDNNCSKKVDLSEQYESSNTLLYRKYIIRAE